MIQGNEDLRARLDRVLREAEARRRCHVEGRAEEMVALTERLDRSAALTGAWLGEVVAPRLETLASAFANACPPQVGEEAGEAGVDFKVTDEFPATAGIKVSFAHDAAAKRIRTTFRARIIPLLMPFDVQEGELVLEPRDEERPKLEAFLDDRLCQFAEQYLRIREPGSPYQKDQTVVDPVCGMALRRWEATATARHGDETYYFCVDECRRRFEAEPGRYARH